MDSQTELALSWEFRGRYQVRLFHETPRWGTSCLSPGFFTWFLDGTSLFDSLWSTCYYEFRGQQEDVQKILLLLSDGVDTSSHATLEQAVGACQQAHASVFVLTSTPDLSDLSMGQRTLRKLTEQTGGSVILCCGSEVEVSHAIDALATDIRSEYQLFYRPQNLKRDGSFHRIVLVGPPRVAAIVGQSGYYALPK